MPARRNLSLMTERSELGGEMTRFLRPSGEAVTFKSCLLVLVSLHVSCYTVAVSSGHAGFILFHLTL